MDHSITGIMYPDIGCSLYIFEFWKHGGRSFKESRKFKVYCVYLRIFYLTCDHSVHGCLRRCQTYSNPKSNNFLQARFQLSSTILYSYLRNFFSMLKPNQFFCQYRPDFECHVELGQKIWFLIETLA
jgi:hypothetical protein